MNEKIKTYEDYRFELGSMMKDLRLEKTHTLESLSERTKIPLKTLTALEEGEASFFRERLYSRGFISLICRELKADPAPFLNKLDYCENKEQKPKTPQMVPETPSSPRKRRKTFFARKSLLFSFLVLLFLTISLLYKNFSDEKKTSPHKMPPHGEHKHTAKNSPTPACKKQMKASSHSKNETACLTIRVLEDTRFQTREDGKLRHEKPYKPGDYHFYYKEKLQFSFEDASLVEVIREGKNEGPLSREKEKKTATFPF